MEQSMQPDQNTQYGTEYATRSEYSIWSRVCNQIRILNNEQSMQPDQNTQYGAEYATRSE